MIYIVLAFITGGLVILSMIVNSQLSKRIGVFQGTFINYMGGMIFTILIILFFSRKDIILSQYDFSNIPLWGYLGGLIGVMVVAISNVIIPKIPTIYSTLLIFLGQLFSGLVIDHFMGLNISKGKIIGGLLIVTGLIYNFKLDKNETVLENNMEAVKS